MAYLGEEPKFGSFASETFSGNGSATSFTLTHGAASPSSLLVTIDGVKQQTTAYTITDTSLDFGSGNAPAAGTNNIEVVYLGTKSLVGAVADGAITTSKIANNAVTGAKIAMGSDAAGDILTYTGTDYVRLAKGTASQTLKMNSGATAVEWGTDVGKVLQVVTTKSQTLVSSTSIISMETSTAITNTQGVECLTATITPGATNNRLVVQCSFTGTSENGSVHSIALFQDSGTNAIACCNSQTNGTDSGSTISMIWEQAAGTTSATTFKIRVGPHSSTTVYMNGRNNDVKWGGVPVSTLQIWEIAA